MPLSVAQQRARKLALLSERLSAAGIVWSEPIAFANSPAVGYRSRIRLRIDSGRLCFFNDEKHVSCAVLDERLLRCRDELMQLAERDTAALAAFAHVELRAPDDRGNAGLVLAAKSPDATIEPALVTLRRTLPRWLVGVVGDAMNPWQQRTIVGGVFAYVPIDAFWQINSVVNAALVSAITRRARRHGVRRALDLYAGAGNFTLPLAALDIDVTAVERHEPSMRALLAAARAQGLACAAIAELAETACERLTQVNAPDLVIIDGPRAGAETVARRVGALAPPLIAVCSCNPATLARDLAILCDSGYRLEELQAFDMFAQTEHLEVLAWLVRAG